MNIRIQVSKILLSLAVAGSPFALHAQTATAPTNYVLQWSDDFKSPVLDTSKWNYRVDVKDYTAQRAQNVSLDGKGHLNINLRQEEYAGKHFTAGGVVSKANFRYGYYEVSAKTTHFPGWHTAFWMLAGDGRLIPPRFPAVSNTWTEIDDFEIEDPLVISMGTLEWQHGQNNGSTRCDAHFVPGFDTAAAYHTYGLEWTEQDITYYLDGKPICKQSYPPSQSPHDRLNIWLTSIAHKSGVPFTDKSVPADIGLAVGATPSPASFGKVAYYIRDYYIRDTESGYAEYGSGWTDGMLPGYSRLGSRVSCSTGASAVWTPTIMQGGQYEISIYRTSNPRYDSASQVVIHSHDGNTAKAVNFKAGDEGWVSLGTFSLDPGSDASVTESGSGQDCLYADTVKFVRR